MKIKRTRQWLGLVPVVFCLFLAGCRGSPSDKPPVHLVLDMDRQEKYKAQSESAFFENRMTMRPVAEGTIARGHLKEDKAYFEGKNEDGGFVKKAPVSFATQDIERGKERYNIYCTPCHGLTAKGDGKVAQRGFPPPPSFHNERAYQFEDGYLFDKITRGSALMRSYAHQISVADRWKIVGYIRQLQEQEKNAK